MSNPNTDYERLVAEIHQGMLRYEGVENLRVKHNVVVKGKSGASHQIDVFWEFKLAGTTYRTCVECKNYSSAVKKMHVASFAEVLRDIGNANGIIATTNSFQKGAKLLAKENGIRLVLVNYLIKSIHFTLHPLVSDFVNFKFNFNDVSVKQALECKGLLSYNLEFTYYGEDYLLDSLGNEKIKLKDLVNDTTLKAGHNVVECVDLFLDIEGLGLVQVDLLEVDMVQYMAAPIKSVVKSPYSARAVIEDIVSNNVHYLHDDGSVNTQIEILDEANNASGDVFGF